MFCAIVKSAGNWHMRFIELGASTVVLLAGLWLEKLNMRDSDVLLVFNCMMRPKCHLT